MSAGRKDDDGKVKMHLLPWAALIQVAKVLMFGEKKYGRDNWREVEHWNDRYISAALRHIAAWESGETADPDSGLPHVAHAACSLLFVAWLWEREEKRRGRKAYEEAQIRAAVGAITTDCKAALFGGDAERLLNACEHECPASGLPCIHAPGHACPHECRECVR